MNIEKFLHEKRIQSGFSQTEIAEKVKLSNSYISLVESGKRHLPLGKLEELLNLYGYTIQIVKKNGEK